MTHTPSIQLDKPLLHHNGSDEQQFNLNKQSHLLCGLNLVGYREGARVTWVCVKFAYGVTNTSSFICRAPNTEVMHCSELCLAFYLHCI